MMGLSGLVRSQRSDSRAGRAPGSRRRAGLGNELCRFSFGRNHLEKPSSSTLVRHSPVPSVLPT